LRPEAVLEAGPMEELATGGHVATDDVPFSGLAQHTWVLA